MRNVHGFIDILHDAILILSSVHELLDKIANGIFFFDPVNEEALHIKSKSLNVLGRHSLAKSTYDKFLKQYFYMYGENYNNLIYKTAANGVLAILA